MAKKILIVDDSASLRQVVAIALTGAGYEVVQATDGENGLARLAELAGQKLHLIISDVNMPKMDGITFVKTLKQMSDYRFTPVIMLTTEGQDAIKESGRAAGAKAWIVKPFNPPQMLNAVAKLILP